MTEVISVRFKDSGKAYYFDPRGEQFAKGDNVIVATSRWLVYGEVTEGNHKVPDESIIKPLREVERRATEADERRNEENRRKEKEAFAICEKKIAEHKLDMKLVSAEYAFEGGKVLFYFIADGRVDFRELVKDLASALHTRIELRQIGVRDEAKMQGGLGVCGKEFVGFLLALKGSVVVPLLGEGIEGIVHGVRINLELLHKIGRTGITLCIHEILDTFYNFAIVQISEVV